MKPKVQKKPGRATSGWHAVAQNLAAEMVVKDKTIANLWERIHALQTKLDERTAAGNKLAEASARLIRDSERLEKHRDLCAEFAKIYALALVQTVKLSAPVFETPKPNPAGEPTREREG